MSRPLAVLIVTGTPGALGARVERLSASLGQDG